MITKYYANGWTWIDVVEFDRETDKSLFLGERRVSKTTEWGVYFDTREEALAWLVSQAEKRIVKAKIQLEAEMRTRDAIFAKHGQPPISP